MDTPQFNPPFDHPFTQGLAEGRLRHLRCGACGHTPPGQRTACPACGSTGLAWVDATGRGTVWALSTVHRAPTEAWRARVPYTLLLVALDDGPRVMGVLVEPAPGQRAPRIGDRVQAATAWLGEQPLLQFQPAPAD